MSRGAASSWWDIDAWPTPRKIGLVAVLALLVGAAITVTAGRDQQTAAELASRPQAPSTDLLQAVIDSRPPVALWFGDSFTAGTGATGQGTAESCLTSVALGYVCALDAQGGTGYVADGQVNSKSFQPLGKRLPETASQYQHPDLIVIDAGRNDGTAPIAEVEAAAARYYNGIEKAYPNKPVVLIAPYFMGDGPGAFADLRAWMRQQAKARDWVFIDPIAEGWTRSWSGLVIADGVHPSPAGHKAIAERLSAALAELKARS